MLSKLLKYDLKYMLQNMLVFYIFAIFFGLTTRILFSLNQTFMVSILSQVSVGCMFAMIVNIIINTVMRSWVRFKDFIYGDESYLTHTLPVTKNDIYNSKFVQTIIFSVIGFIVIIGSLFIAYYTFDRWLLLKDFINSISTGLNINTMLFVISIIVIFFLEILNTIQSGFLGIILGHNKNNNKIGFSVLYGFISYLLSQGVVLLLIFILGLFNNNIMELFKSSMILDNDTIQLLIIFAILVYLLIIWIMNLICKYKFNIGVNVE